MKNEFVNDRSKITKKRNLINIKSFVCFIVGFSLKIISTILLLKPDLISEIKGLFGFIFGDCLMLLAVIGVVEYYYWASKFHNVNMFLQLKKEIQKVKK